VNEDSGEKLNKIELEIQSIFSSALLIREAETQISQHYLVEKIFSVVHFCIGQEVSASVFGHLARDYDRFFGNHRSHGHYLAKGGNLTAMFAEMLGKPSGCSGGKGGSMHMIDRAVNFMGSSPILGSAVPIALGSAWQQKIAEPPALSVVFTGDGATEEGSFYESLNLAALWKLPILIVVENNSWAIKSPIASRRPEGYSLQALSEALGVRFFSGASSDVFSFLDNAKDAFAHVSSGKGPALFEAQVERLLEHSSPLKPKNSDELFERDPLVALRSEVLASGMSSNELKELEDKTERFVRDCLNEAIQSPDFDWPAHE
jgi:TPP-dependent pyruvate/acetoin dehydrogenase alpha subunit